MINLPTLISLCVLAFCVGVSNGSPSALPVTKKTSTLPPPSNPEIAQTVECPMPCGPDKCCGYYPDMCNWHSVDGYSCLSDAEEEEEEEETPTEEPPAEEEGEEEEGAGEEEEEEGTTTPAPVEEMTPPEDLTFGRVSSDSCPMPCGTEGVGRQREREGRNGIETVFKLAWSFRPHNTFMFAMPCLPHVSLLFFSSFHLFLLFILYPGRAS
uniref:Uncharacterized protein n=1 Tax=Chromera velia CCMP2878 TaxID=1169474 RepID=A0A0G4HMY4_9ALVE|eukprot:Cvel_29447.t1-p1 / transcript=Cvel_29447.t1 / gene=Cvel_29447 / organism=Chromera_velia_CCMP2878 / gene_product=hypothetical protein / transcript_product=hypothetical protein / location=Cvel_scaffold4027:10304-11427(+) / protein_length=210 / sequence_SO=supercontig / SO=protein_coding / is_pseudo=false